MRSFLFCLLPVMLFSCHNSDDLGTIDFLEKVRPQDDYRNSDLLDFTDDSNIGITINLKKSLKEYLIDLAPTTSWDQLCATGNFQFTFYVDDVMVYQENLNHGAGTCDQKNHTQITVPLASTQYEDRWGRYLWMRFLYRGGGDQALKERGKHKLRIELRPYIERGNIVVGNIIAAGTTILNTIKPIATTDEIKMQEIGVDSGWEVSDGKINQDLIQKLKKRIIEKDFRDITSIVVAKNGKLLLEEYFNEADRNTLHNPRSVGKTFASTAMGLAIRDGYIASVNATLSDYYDLNKFSNYNSKKENISIKRLLTMSSGFDADDNDYDSPGNEEYMYPTDDWVKFALDLKIDEVRIQQPSWQYFTAGVVVLGEILHRNLPGGLEEYLDKQLFAPMDITNYQWQYTTTDVPNTAGGLQLRAIDFAKYGQVYKNKGIWKGQQLIPSEWVEESLTGHISRSSNNEEQYGYLFWKDILTVNGKSYGVSYCTGNGGNKIYIFDDLPFVIVITAQAYNMPYAHPQVKKMMEEYILPSVL